MADYNKWMIWSAFYRTALALLAGAVVCACSDDGAATNLPGGGLYATIAVGEETFHASITHPDGEAQARAVWAGTSGANIPTGELVCSPTRWNEPWHWYLAPDSVRFAEVTTEVCDGAPGYVETHCEGFGAGRYCPWAAELVDLRDCSVDPECPQVPRP
jgi:hypothetical protein